MVCCDRHSGAPQGELCATQHRHLKKKELKNPRGVQTRNICPKINDKSTVLLKRRDARVLELPQDAYCNTWTPVAGGAVTVSVAPLTSTSPEAVGVVSSDQLPGVPNTAKGKLACGLGAPLLWEHAETAGCPWYVPLAVVTVNGVTCVSGLMEMLSATDCGFVGKTTAVTVGPGTTLTVSGALGSA